MLVDIHADDYGYSVNTSKDILECMKQGCLNSISIISNTNAFEESVELLYKTIPELPFLPLLSVHINLPEGYGESLPLSWVKLFFSSKSVKEKIKKEISKQINDVNAVVDKCIEIAKINNVACYQKGIRLDTHVHTHPIPVVWQSLLEVIEEEKLHIEYIRNPKEPIVPFIKHTKLLPTYGVANLIKNRILMLLSGKIDRYCDGNSIQKMYMWGLTMSGKMDFNRVNELYDDMYNYANKHNRNLEILFHPGMALKNEYSSEMNIDYFNNANSSNNRHIEKETVLNIKKIVK